MKKLNMRSKITVRWTTNPGDLGYDGKKSNWMNDSGEIMSIRNASEFAYKLGQKIGHGAYCAINYQNNGRAVTKNEIDTIILMAMSDSVCV